MSVFTEAELNYLRTERLLARIATVGQDGTPHITRVEWSLNSDDQVIDVGGINLASTKKFRDIARSGRGHRHRRRAATLAAARRRDSWKGRSDYRTQPANPHPS